MSADTLRDTGAPDGEDRPSKGQPLVDPAAAEAPGQRRPDEDLKRRQEQLIDEAVA